MQALTKLIQEAKRKQNTTDQQILNLIREYLQVLILKAIYQTKYGRGFSFMGGTCLRICYDLKRYSEDLDFTYDRNISAYSFDELNQLAARFLKDRGFEIETKVTENKTVQKSFIKINHVLHAFDLSAFKDQKLQIKLEVDTNPVKVDDTERENFFVTKFNEMFPIIKHTNPTLFAGKISAVFNRPYAKGRDFYDLLWYFNQKTKINLNYLNQALKQIGSETHFDTINSVVEALEKRLEEVSIEVLMKDLHPFLEDLSEKQALQHYPIVFKQLTEQYLKAL